MRSLWMAAACLVVLTTTQAQTPTAPATPAAKAASAPSTQALPRVEISGATDDDSLRRKDPIGKAIYGRDELDRQGDIDVTDVLKRLPGVSMDGGAPRLRGLGGGYTQVLINGEPAPPGFLLDTLAPGDVDRIEVIKGATAEFAGVAGTINLVLREPPRTRQREWRSNLSYRTVEPGGGTAFQWGDRIGDISFVVPVNINRTAQGNQSQTMRISRNRAGEVQQQALSGRDQSIGLNAQIAPRLQWKINERDTLSLNAFAQHSESRSQGERRNTSLQGTPVTTVADQSRGESDSEVIRLQGSWQRRLADGGKLELKSSWQDTRRDSVSHSTGQRADNTASVQRESQSAFSESRATVGARWNQPVSDAHTLVSGIDAETREREDVRRVSDFGLPRSDKFNGMPFVAQIDRTALFMQDEWAVNGNWSMLPGLRFEQIRTRSSSSIDKDSAQAIDNTARVLAPVLHLNYKFDAKGKDQLRAQLSRSFKLPELSSLAARYVLNGSYESDITNTPIAADRAGNPALQPELSTGFDLAYEHYPAGGGVFSVGIFLRRIDDLIRQRIALETTLIPGLTTAPRWVSRPVNAGRARSQGLEFELKGRAEEWLPVLFNTDSGVQLRAAWNFYRSRVEQVEGPDNRLEAQPPWLANLGFDARIKNSDWNVGASLVMQPGYLTQQTDRQLSRRSGVRTLDAFVSWRMDRSSQLRVAVANLLAPDNDTANSIADIDGFSAGSQTHRDTFRSFNVSWVLRF